MSNTSPTIQRPLSDFLNAQGTAFGPVEFAWATARSSMPNCAGEPFGQIDYAGVKNGLIVAGGGQSLGTTFTGSVSQSANADGTSTVKVTLNTANAFAVAYCLTDTVSAPYFGYTTKEVIAGKPATTGSSHLSIVFVMDGTSATTPLPDLVALNATCPPTPCFTSLKFSGTAAGPLRAIYGVPEGTPGNMSIDSTTTLKLTGYAGRNGGLTANFVTVLPTK